MHNSLGHEKFADNPVQIVFGYGMKLNPPAAAPEFANIAQAMGVSKEETEVQAASHQAATAVAQLAEEVGRPHRTGKVGVQKEAIPRMAQDAIQSSHIARNPHSLRLADLITVCERAY